jgi:hypothetical protein
VRLGACIFALALDRVFAAFVLFVGTKPFPAKHAYHVLHTNQGCSHSFSRWYGHVRAALPYSGWLARQSHPFRVLCRTTRSRETPGEVAPFRLSFFPPLAGNSLSLQSEPLAQSATRSLFTRCLRLSARTLARDMLSSPRQLRQKS